MTQDDATTQLSIQETLYPQLTCFGCGHANAKGLKLRSYPGDGFVTAAFEPWPEHDNGFGFLNGGIIATVLDCHSGAAVFHRAHELGMEPSPGSPLLYVTAGLDLRYLRPVPLGQTLELRAVVAVGGRRPGDRRGGAGVGRQAPCGSDHAVEALAPALSQLTPPRGPAAVSAG